MDIRLDAPHLIPSSFRCKLKQHESLLKSCDYMEEILGESSVYEVSSVRGIAERFEKFVHANTVLGYHCTKEPKPGYFLNHGLHALDRESHQTEFLSLYGSHFSTEEREAIDDAWSSYFPGGQDEGRNGRLWFCMSAHAVIHDHTSRFFEYFGGEAIWKPLLGHSDIAAKLRTLGKPVVVEVRISPEELTTFRQLPFARDAFSHYHRQVNPSAFIDSLEGYISRCVTSQEIVRIVPKDDFFAEHST